MKDLSTELLQHYAQATQTLAIGWKVTRTDGQVFGWTSHDLSVPIDGVGYLATGGLDASSVRTSQDFSVPTLDVSAFLDVSTEEEITAGVWDGAAVVIFEYNWNDLPTLLNADVNVLRSGRLGQLTRQQGRFTAEIRGHSERLAFRIGRAYTITCPWRHAQWNGTTYVSSVECNVDLTPFIIDGTLTGVGSDPRLTLIDTASAQEGGYFSEGLITITSGDNTGVTREVRLWQNKTFELYRPFPYALAGTETYRAVAGDDKQEATCRDRFDNIVNPTSGGFSGFTTIPGFAAVYGLPPGV